MDKTCAFDSAVECTKSRAYSYLQKTFKLNLLLESLKDAYKKKMNEFLSIFISSSPREILPRLRERDKGDWQDELQGFFLNLPSAGKIIS